MYFLIKEETRATYINCPRCKTSYEQWPGHLPTEIYFIRRNISFKYKSQVKYSLLFV